MLELLGANTGNSLRAAISLHEAKLAFKATMVDLRAGAQRTPEFRALNPSAQVPVLIDRGRPNSPFVLAQSNAIMFYAVDHGPPGALLPLGGSDRARALERYFYFLTDVIAFSQTAFFLSSQGEVGGATVLEARLIERLEVSERFLSEGSYMAGDEFSLADIAAFTMALAYRGRLDWRTGRPLVQWFAQIEARPAVMRGLQSFRKA